MRQAPRSVCSQQTLTNKGFWGIVFIIFGQFLALLFKQMVREDWMSEDVALNWFRVTTIVTILGLFLIIIHIPDLYAARRKRESRMMKMMDVARKQMEPETHNFIAAPPRSFSTYFTDRDGPGVKTAPVEPKWVEIPQKLTKTSAVLKITGQGTLKFRMNTTEPFRVIFTGINDPDPTRGGNSNCICFVIGRNSKETTCRYHNNDLPTSIIDGAKYPTPHMACFDSGLDTHYWFSVDSANGNLKFGKGEMHTANCQIDISGQKLPWFKTIKNVWLDGGRGTVEGDFYINDEPIVVAPPPLVKAHDEITINDIAGNLAVTEQSLPEGCQFLYKNIAGEGVSTDESVIGFPLAEAIEQSIADKSGWVYKKLVQKSSTFGKPDPNAILPTKNTYLRITIGPSLGSSPGSPYVMEIWPAGGHCSPIHKHSEANAIIKVLHGTIHTDLYADLRPDITEPFVSADFTKGDCTYLTPDLYQIHKLTNPFKEVCITLQCYRYANTDSEHYEFFDYLANDGTIHQFAPNSDSQYLDFIELIGREYWSRKNVGAAKADELAKAGSQKARMSLIAGKQRASMAQMGRGVNLLAGTASSPPRGPPRISTRGGGSRGGSRLVSSSPYATGGRASGFGSSRFSGRYNGGLLTTKSGRGGGGTLGALHEHTPHDEFGNATPRNLNLNSKSSDGYQESVKL